MLLIYFIVSLLDYCHCCYLLSRGRPTPNNISIIKSDAQINSSLFQIWRTTPPTLHFRNLGSSSCKCIFNVHSMTRFGHNQASRCKTLKFTLRKSAPAFKAIAGSWPKCAESCWPGQLKHMKTNHAPRGCGTKCRDSCGPGNSPAALRKRVCFKPHASRASRTEPGIRWQQKPMALMHSSMVLHAIIISRAIHVDILDTLNVDTLWSRQDSEKTQRKDRIKYSNQIVKSKQLFP